MQQCIHADGGAFEVLHGFDEILITGLSVGAKAAVGSTYNYLSDVYLGIMKAMESMGGTCRQIRKQSCDGSHGKGRP